MKTFGTVGIIGLGYIGLPTAVVLARAGVRVTGVDINSRAVDSVNRGEVHIVEPGLDVLLREAVFSGQFTATANPAPADAFLIAVPTPFKGDNYEPDMSYVESAVASLAPVLVPGNLVILESTSPVGSTDAISEQLASLRPELRFPHQFGDIADVQVAYCPERVLPGKIVHELVQNDRVVGGVSARCADHAAELYRIFVKGQVLKTNARTAEMCKLTENSFRDVNIAFANELSMICEELNIDVWELVGLANHHPRVNILQPGPGVGGHCIAVDPWFIVHSAPKVARLIRAAREVNNSKPEHVVASVKEAAKGKKSPVVACLGLAFKADIDDLRESPAVEIVKELAQDGFARVLAVEPHVRELPPELKSHKKIILTDERTAIEQSDVVVLLVNHKQFLSIDPELLANKIVIDTRGMFRDEASFGTRRRRSRAASTGAAS
jgi:UDP-N-acetyl-D-mannosaminuronic acid dehydrogenase